MFPYLQFMTWEYYWFRIEMLVLLFGLFPLLFAEGMKVNLEKKELEMDKRIDTYIMGELR